MDDEVFDSYAQNGEDVILWRALRDIVNGRYVDVGANDPSYLSITKAFYDHGWRGISVEPSHHYAQLHRDQRPGDIVVEAAVASRSGDTVTLHEIAGSGLSTLVDEIRDRHARDGWAVREVKVATRTLNEILDEASWSGQDIHFMTIDVEGTEGDVLASLDLRRWRPWVLVVESTAPNSTNETHGTWEPGVLDAGYQYCLFDGLSRYYVANEHADALRHKLSYSPSVFDSYRTNLERHLADSLRSATDAAAYWRAESEGSDRRNEALVERLQTEMTAIKNSRSWRITAPLRAARRLMSRS